MGPKYWQVLPKIIQIPASTAAGLCEVLHLQIIWIAMLKINIENITLQINFKEI